MNHDPRQYPEWLQRELDEIEADRTRTARRRAALGLGYLALIATVALVLNNV